MGFFGRTKKTVATGPSAADSSAVSVLTTTPSEGSDISDDYVAPDIEAVGVAGVAEEGAEGEGATPVGEDAPPVSAAAVDEGAAASAPEPEGTSPELEGTPSALDGVRSQPEDVPPVPGGVPSGPTGPRPSFDPSADPSFEGADGADAAAPGIVDAGYVGDGYVEAGAAEGVGAPADVEGGYVEAGAAGVEGGEAPPAPADDAVTAEKEVFDGVKGTVQLPKYKDLKYAWMFALHQALTAFWFVDSFFPKYNQYNNAYYSKTSHAGLSAFVATAGLAGLGLAFLAFGYMLRHGETILRSTIAFSTGMCLCVGVAGLCLGELSMAACGFVGFAATSMYMNTVWQRIPFTAANLSVAIAAVRDNMGLLVAALLVAAAGFVWAWVAVVAGVDARRNYGNWTVVVIAFSYYWTHQVLRNVLAVTTAGIVGRWFVIGEETPTFTAGLKETLARARTYSFGSVCFGSLFFGASQTIRGLSDFLLSKGVPLLPRLLDAVLRLLDRAAGDADARAYAHVGMYGYSYAAASRNVAVLLRNKGWDGIVDRHLAPDVTLMADVAIGLLSGTCGLLFGAFEYRVMWSSGFTSPTTDGFVVGFLVGFLMSSIFLSVVSSTLNTLVVCLAESPAEFQANHPELSQKLVGAWRKKANEVGARM